MDNLEALPTCLEPFDMESHEMDDTPVIAENGESGDKSNEDLEGEEDENPFADDDDSDEEGGGVQVTIRKVDTTSTFSKSHQQGKLDIDSTPLLNDKPIYDIDLAQMDDRPWRKPGADITDYFNYGFTEETWNVYCERQKKLRNEFGGNQAKTNQVLFGNIQLVNPLAAPNMPQNVGKWGTTQKAADQGSVVKVLTDNGGRFKPQQYIPHQTSEPVLRAVIGGPAPTTAQPSMGPPIIDFSRPPPGMSMPPPGMGPLPPMVTPSSQPISSMPTSSIQSTGKCSEAPPGIDPSAADRPPGVLTPPGASSSNNPPGVTSVPGSIPGVPGALDLNLGVPPPGFNPNMPPPGMPPNLGMLSTNLPPPGFNMPPMSYPPNHQRAGFGPPQGSGMSQRGGVASYASGGGGGPSDSRRESNDYEEDDERKSSRRKRSRSRSPRKDSSSRRRGTERERSDRERTERTSSRRHRSRSTSTDRTEKKRHREDRSDRDKRRERRDEEERSSKKSSRRRENDEEDRRDRKERKSRHSDEHDILLENGVSAQELADESASP